MVRHATGPSGGVELFAHNVSSYLGRRSECASPS